MYDLVIVGAGPAGLTAAVTAADHGLSVLVVDEQRRPGGQIFRQPPPEFQEPVRVPGAYRWGRALLRDCEQRTDISWRFSTTAYGVLRDDDDPDGLRLALYRAEGPELVRARRLLVATGAYDLPVAFPGWTLPGVLTAGGVQTLLKSQRLLAARRLVLAGSHPLLLLVADQLRAAGAEIAEVAFARGLPRPQEALAALPAVPGHLRLLTESAAAAARLIAARVPIRTHTIVTAAIGADRVTRVALAPVDRHWRVTGPRRTVAADALVIGYGFAPSTELARQAGCRLRWDSPAGGWVVAHDQRMRTSAAGVYVAGEPTGVAGADQARAQGRLAGLAIVDDLRPGGRAVPERELAAARRAVQAAARFSRVVQRMFAPRREALAALAAPETVVCRCELVTRADLDRTLEAHPYLSSVNAVKLECRTGMGPCQGRYCETTVATVLSRTRGLPASQLGHFHAHLPVKPVPLEALTTLDQD